MTRFVETLWDLLAKPKQRVAPAADHSRTSKSVSTRAIVDAPASQRNSGAKLTMQQRYDALVVEMKQTYNVRIKKWRKSSTGVAWTLRYRDGSIVKCIAAPYPRGPMSCAVFLHEIGHHAIGLGVHQPRCLEEYHVWVWALKKMREKDFAVTPAVEKRVHQSLQYAVAKARRRGIKRLPRELHPYA